MTLPHRIRLAGFWQMTPISADRVRHERRFGRPRTLDPLESVWVVGVGVPGPAELSVNGETVGRMEAGQSFAFDMTTRLTPRNTLAIDTDADIPLGEVHIEIRSQG